MFSVYGELWLPPQSLDPVTTRLYAPPGAEDETVTVIVDVASDPGATVTELGLKLTVTPDGAPEAERLTVMEEAEPLTDVTVAVTVVDVLPLEGLSTALLDGVMDIEKSLT
jgi:hypothetical protein